MRPALRFVTACSFVTTSKVQKFRENGPVITNGAIRNFSWKFQNLEITSCFDIYNCTEVQYKLRLHYNTKTSGYNTRTCMCMYACLKWFPA